MGLVGLWVWWPRGSGGPVGLVGPWVWWARGSTLRGPTCQGVLGLVSEEEKQFFKAGDAGDALSKSEAIDW